MKSLWSGVSGLGAHQTAMDVEGHNIANVNTVGFKRKRMSFADHISQTTETATAPHEGKGGKNPMQVGLGTNAQAVTTVFTPGSIERTDVGTHLAINKQDGFFVLSDNDGRTYRYTRNGEFDFDADGNLTTMGGLKVQGWMGDFTTKTIDTTAPIQNITIRPGLNTEAKPTTEILIKANLNSGDYVATEHLTPIGALDKFYHAYDRNKNDITLTDMTTDPWIYETDEGHREENTSDYIFDRDENIIEQSFDMGVAFNVKGESLGIREHQGMWVSYRETVHTIPTVAGGQITLDFKINGQRINETIGHNAGAGGTPPASTAADNAMELMRLINKISGKTGVEASLTDNAQGITLTNDNRSGTTRETKNIIFSDVVADGGMAQIAVNQSKITAYEYQYSSNTSNIAASNIARYQGNGTANAPTYNPADKGGAGPLAPGTGDGNNYGDTERVRFFTTTEDLRGWIQADMLYEGHHTQFNNATITEDSIIDVTVNDKGQLKLEKSAGGDENSGALNIGITGLSNNLTNNDAITENKKLTAVFRAMEGKIAQKNTFRTSQALNVSSLGTEVPIFDSLGSKHMVNIQYRKVGRTIDNGTEWMVKISVPKPGVINETGIGVKNVVTGYVKFNDKGALTAYTPSNITYSPNNGSTPDQDVRLNLGDVGTFGGLTSHDRESKVTDLDQDGYPGGVLLETTIDQAGNVLGEFSNGQHFILAKVGIATFANPEGLRNEGGNTFTRTPNSGNAVINTADAEGLGSLSSRSLEMSNVDLSKSLTKLIVIQRGFQANSKTITTSDQMLNTLLQLKQ